METPTGFQQRNNHLHGHAPMKKRRYVADPICELATIPRCFTSAGRSSPEEELEPEASGGVGIYHTSFVLILLEFRGFT